jgi:F-type H+-transporting ATPase subunit delta
MSLRTSATRYAKALLEVGIKESDPVAIERDLSSIVKAMTTHAALQRALTSPRIPLTTRVNVVRALTEEIGVQPPVAKLMIMLAERGRLNLMPDLLEVYRERQLAHSNIVRASVTVATPVSEDKVKELGQSLSKLTGKTVQLDVSVDPALIGGVVTKIGSTVYDGSIRTQLQKMKQQMVEQA